MGGDAQTAHEKTVTGLLPALGGLNLIYGAGMIESGVTIDYGVLVMDNEIARIAKYILRGIPTNDATLMVDEIIEVGSEEDFLSRMSTLKLMREHQSKAGLIDRRVREEWEMDGSTDLYYRSNERAKELVESHKVEELPSDVKDQIRAIVAKSEKDAGVA
jgi:trimethylamine--corrinoid protein Co-methyltransferase